MFSFSLELPYRGDSNEYTQHTIINIKMKITLNYPNNDNVCSFGMFSKGLKSKFEIAVVGEPSVFQPLEFNCIFDRRYVFLRLVCGNPVHTNFTIRIYSIHKIQKNARFLLPSYVQLLFAVQSQISQTAQARSNSSPYTLGAVKTI